MAALFLAFSGCLFITGVFQSSMHLTPVALSYGLGAGFGYSLYSIFGHFAVKAYHPFTITLYTFLFAGLVTLPLIHPIPLARLMIASPGAVLPILLSGVVCGVFPYIFYTIGLTYVEPVVATLVSVFYLKEKLTWTAALGICLVLTALVLLNLKTNITAKKPA